MSFRTFTSPHCKLPAGRYALYYKPTSAVRFFTVEYGNPKGRYPYFLFLTEHAGPNRIPIRQKELKDTIISAILRDVPAALRMFAVETNTCGKCGTELTDPESRSRGIGPVCLKAYESLGFTF